MTNYKCATLILDQGFSREIPANVVKTLENAISETNAGHMGVSDIVSVPPKLAPMPRANAETVWYFVCGGVVVAECGLLSGFYGMFHELHKFEVAESLPR